MEKENIRLKRLVADLSLDKAILKDVLLSPARRREMVENAMKYYGVSERKACRVLDYFKWKNAHIVRREK